MENLRQRRKGAESFSPKRQRLMVVVLLNTASHTGKTLPFIPGSLLATLRLFELRFQDQCFIGLGGSLLVA